MIRYNRMHPNLVVSLLLQGPHRLLHLPGLSDSGRVQERSYALQKSVGILVPLSGTEAAISSILSKFYEPHVQRSLIGQSH
jgi:hypothetical protein